MHADVVDPIQVSCLANFAAALERRIEDASHAVRIRDRRAIVAGRSQLDAIRARVRDQRRLTGAARYAQFEAAPTALPERVALHLDTGIDGTELAQRALDASAIAQVGFDLDVVPHEPPQSGCEPIHPGRLHGRRTPARSKSRNEARCDAAAMSSSSIVTSRPPSTTMRPLTSTV